MIYFVRGTRSGMVKIGHTTRLKGRIPTLQTGSPEPLEVLAVMDGDEQTERDLHARFSAARAHGEWFHPRPPLMRLIDHLASGSKPENYALARRRERRRRGSDVALRERLDAVQVAADRAGLTVREWIDLQRGG